MKHKIIKVNKAFVGRHYERQRINEILSQSEASILVVHGRRRVGKTELLEQTFRNHRILKFEGIEGKSAEFQKQHVLRQLAQYSGQPLDAKLRLDSWIEIFERISDYVKRGTWTVYFEEVQWLANYQTDFITELKYVWDNRFKANPKLRVLLCGSSPSFMINQVLQSKALHNRSQTELPLKEFSLMETHDFFKRKSYSETMDAYLSVGGIPEYLKKLTRPSSILLALCENSFTQGSFFSNEHERIFASSLAENKHYKKIVQVLSQKKSMTREQIAKQLKIKTGGGVSTLLADLTQCQLIEKIIPYHLAENSHLARYALSDAFLQFYYKFIHPIQHDISSGIFNSDPVKAVHISSLQKWRGFAFERWCRKNHQIIAKILGFSGIRYRSGVFFKRDIEKQPGAGCQIDLIFDRDDKVYTICEIKYLESPAHINVVIDVEKKLACFPNPKGRTIHRVLISASGADSSVVKRTYFDNIITLNDLFNFSSPSK